ncbi:unnamed protein product [Orchesella dallaii]
MDFQYDELICVSASGESQTINGLAKVVFYPCTYYANGCRALLISTQKSEHEMSCTFGGCFCPYPDGSCSWKGSYDEVVPHLYTYHQRVPSWNGEELVISATNINVPGPLYWVVLQLCYGHSFVIVIGKHYRENGEQFHVLVQLIGSRRQCEKFFCRLELTGRGGQRYVWDGPPRSIHDGITSAVNNNECFLFDGSIAHFCSSSGTLQVVVNISMETEADGSTQGAQVNTFKSPNPRKHDREVSVSHSNFFS